MTSWWGWLVRAATAAVGAASLIGAPSTSATSASEPVAASGVPTQTQWLVDVHEVLAPAKAFVRARTAPGTVPDGERLALNLDIDNTALETYYAGGGAIPDMLRLTRLAERRGVAVLFNTGRAEPMRTRTLTQLRTAGYQVDGLCLRRVGESLVHGKQRCRDQFAADGYTLIADLGNNPTDFTGTGYERAFRLPNYGGRLG